MFSLTAAYIASSLISKFSSPLQNIFQGGLEFGRKDWVLIVQLIE